MKLQNKNGNSFSHTVMKKVKVDGHEVTKPVTYTLGAGAVADIPDDIAKIWLKINGVEEYVAPADLKKVEEEAKKDLEALKKEADELRAENEALKKELDNIKAENAVGQAKDSPELEALKKEADELGIQYAKNIGVEALTKKIEAKKAEK